MLVLLSIRICFDPSEMNRCKAPQYIVVDSVEELYNLSDPSRNLELYIYDNKNESTFINLAHLSCNNLAIYGMGKSIIQLDFPLIWTKRYDFLRFNDITIRMPNEFMQRMTNANNFVFCNVLFDIPYKTIIYLEAKTLYAFPNALTNISIISVNTLRIYFQKESIGHPSLSWNGTLKRCPCIELSALDINISIYYRMNLLTIIQDDYDFRITISSSSLISMSGISSNISIDFEEESQIILSFFIINCRCELNGNIKKALLGRSFINAMNSNINFHGDEFIIDLKLMDRCDLSFTTQNCYVSTMEITSADLNIRSYYRNFILNTDKLLIKDGFCISKMYINIPTIKAKRANISNCIDSKLKNAYIVVEISILITNCDSNFSKLICVDAYLTIEFDHRFPERSLFFMENSLPPIEKVSFVDLCGASDITIFPVLYKKIIILISPNYPIKKENLKFSLKYEWNAIGTISQTFVEKINGSDAVGFVFTNIPSQYDMKFEYGDSPVDQNFTFFLDDSNISTIFDLSRANNANFITLVLNKDMIDPISFDFEKKNILTVYGNGHLFRGVYKIDEHAHSLRFINTIIEILSEVDSIESLIVLNISKDSQLTKSTLKVRFSRAIVYCDLNIISDILTISKQVKADIYKSSSIYYRKDGRMIFNNNGVVSTAKIYDYHIVKFGVFTTIDFITEVSDGCISHNITLISYTDGATISFSGNYSKDSKSILLLSKRVVTVVTSSRYLPLKINSIMTKFTTYVEDTIWIAPQKFDITTMNHYFMSDSGFYVFESIDLDANISLVFKEDHFATKELKISTNGTVSHLQIYNTIHVFHSATLTLSNCITSQCVITIDVIPGDSNGFVEFYGSIEEIIPQRVYVNILHSEATDEHTLKDQIIAKLITKASASYFANLTTIENPTMKYNSDDYYLTIYALDLCVWIHYTKVEKINTSEIPQFGVNPLLIIVAISVLSIAFITAISALVPRLSSRDNFELSNDPIVSENSSQE